jgi:hypothetical protein
MWLHNLLFYNHLSILAIANIIFNQDSVRYIDFLFTLLLGTSIALRGKMLKIYLFSFLSFSNINFILNYVKYFSTYEKIQNKKKV